MLSCRPSIRAAVLGPLAAAAILGAGCATPPQDPVQRAAYDEANDPLEPVNRYFFEVNYGLDELVVKPLAGWYYTALPNFVQDRVRDFLRHLATPVVLINDLLQGETERAGVTWTRFFLNTTLGVGGLFDVAAEAGLPYHDEDFGQTLAVAGAGEGPYLMLPLLGPSNPRDLIGRVVDSFLDPTRYVGGDIADLSFVRSGAEGIDLRARNLETLDEIREGAIDYYATIRSLYRQRRDDAIRNGAPAEDEEYPGIIFEDTEADSEDVEVN